MPQPPAPGPRKTFSVTGILTALGGLALLVGVVRQVGVAEIAADVRRVGWGLLAIIALGGLRFLLRAEAWRLCLDPPAHAALAGRVRGGRLRRRDRQPHAARTAGRRAGQGGVRARARRARARGHRAGDRERALHAVGRRDDRGRHGRPARQLQAAAGCPRHRRARDRGDLPAVRRGAVAAVAPAGADQPRAGRRPAAPQTRGPGPSARGGDLHLRVPASIGAARDWSWWRSGSTRSASPKSISRCGCSTRASLRSFPHSCSKPRIGSSPSSSRSCPCGSAWMRRDGRLRGADRPAAEDRSRDRHHPQGPHARLGRGRRPAARP